MTVLAALIGVTFWYRTSLDHGDEPPVALTVAMAVGAVAFVVERTVTFVRTLRRPGVLASWKTKPICVEETD